MAGILDGKHSVRQTAGERGNGWNSLRGAALKGDNIVDDCLLPNACVAGGKFDAKLAHFPIRSLAAA